MSFMGLMLLICWRVIWVPGVYAKSCYPMGTRGLTNNNGNQTPGGNCAHIAYIHDNIAPPGALTRSILNIFHAFVYIFRVFHIFRIFYSFTQEFHMCL